MTTMTTNAMHTSRATGYVMIRDGAPIDVGDDWPDAALATSDRSKCAVLTEADDGSWSARVLHGVSELEAIDSAEKLARDTKTRAAYVARLTGTIGKHAPASLWQRVRRVSAREEPAAKVTAGVTAKGVPYKEVHCKITGKRAQGDDLIIEGWASTENVDRDGEIVLAKAFERTLADSLLSLSLLFNHQTDYICGKILSVEIRNGGLWTRAKVAKSTNPPQVRGWVEDEDLRTFSIRFIVLDDKHDEKGVRNITEAELLEISLVAMPSNRQATFSLSKSLAFGSDLACTDCSAVHCDCDGHGIPFKRYPLAERSSSLTWSDAEAKSILRAGGWDLLRDAHALYRPEKDHDDDGFRKAGSYHLPHHVMIDGELKTSMAGVVNSMRAVLTRSTVLADADRKAAYRHLAAHLTEFELYPPVFELSDNPQLVYPIGQSAPSHGSSARVEPETKMPDATATSPTVAVPGPQASVSGTAASVAQPNIATTPPPHVKVDAAVFAKLQTMAEGMTEAEFLAALQDDPDMFSQVADVLDAAGPGRKPKG